MNDLKKAFPKIPEEIKNNIATQIKECTRERDSYTPFFKFRKIAIAALITVLITSSTVIAASKIYKLHTEKQGEYGHKTYIESTADSNVQTTTEQSEQDSENNFVSIKVNYLPDYMVATFDTDKLLINNSNNFSGMGICITFTTLDSVPETIFDSNVAYSEEFTTNDNSAVYIEKTYGNDLNQRIYVLYKDLNCLMTAYIDSSVSFDEAKKIIEGLDITLTEKADSTSIAIYDFRPHIDANASGHTSGPTSVEKDSDMPIYNMGEEFLYSDYNSSYYITVKDVAIYDNLDAIDSSVLEYYNINPENHLDSDGTFKPDHLKYYTVGDGVNSSYELVYETEVPVKLVYITIDYSTTYYEDDLLFNCNLMFIEETDSSLSIVSPTQSYYDGKYDTVEKNYYYNSPFIYNGENVDDKNHFYNVKSSETKTAYFAFIVPEDSLDNMFIEFINNSTEGAYFSTNTLSSGLIDIRQ